jgi:hypothetical protein
MGVFVTAHRLKRCALSQRRRQLGDLLKFFDCIVLTNMARFWLCSLFDFSKKRANQALIKKNSSGKGHQAWGRREE